MAMFDPVYATEVINDILSQRGLKMVITPKGKPIITAKEQAHGGPIPYKGSISEHTVQIQKGS